MDESAGVDRYQEKYRLHINVHWPASVLPSATSLLHSDSGGIRTHDAAGFAVQKDNYYQLR